MLLYHKSLIRNLSVWCLKTSIIWITNIVSTACCCTRSIWLIQIVAFLCMLFIELSFSKKSSCLISLSQPYSFIFLWEQDCFFGYCCCRKSPYKYISIHSSCLDILCLKQAYPYSTFHCHTHVMPLQWLICFSL